MIGWFYGYYHYDYSNHLFNFHQPPPPSGPFNVRATIVSLPHKGGVYPSCMMCRSKMIKKQETDQERRERRWGGGGGWGERRWLGDEWECLKCERLGRQGGGRTGEMRYGMRVGVGDYSGVVNGVMFGEVGDRVMGCKAWELGEGEGGRRGEVIEEAVLRTWNFRFFFFFFFFLNFNFNFISISF